MLRSRPSAVLAGLLMVVVLTAGCTVERSDRPAADAAPVPTPAVPGTPEVASVPETTGGPAAPEPPTDPATVAPCTGPGLAVSLGVPAVAPDALTQDMFFQNTGTAPCLLRGFPAVSFVAGNEGTRIGEQALPSGERGPEVRLQPRDAAVVSLRMAPAASYDATRCRPVSVRGLRVAPPGGSGSVFVPREDTVCSGDPLPEPQLRVSTVVAR